MELFLPRHDLWLFLIIAAVGAFAGAYFARRTFMLGVAAFVVTLPILLFLSDLGYFISESVGRPAVHLTDYGWDAYLLATAVSLPSFAVCLWVPWIVAAIVVRLSARRRDATRNPSQ